MKREHRAVRVIPVRPWHTILGISLMVGGALIVGVLGSNWHVAGRIAALQEERDHLVGQAIESEQEIERLRSELAAAELTSGVSQGAMEDLQTNLSSQQLELAALREEVTHYRSILAPTSLARGLQVANFKLLATNRSDSFRYEMLLTQLETNKATISGTVALEILTDKSGQEIRLPLNKVQKIDYYPLQYSFRYFQNFSGTLALPAGHSPLRVLITITPERKGGEQVQRSFPWVVESS